MFHQKLHLDSLYINLKVSYSITEIYNCVYVLSNGQERHDNRDNVLDKLSS